MEALNNRHIGSYIAGPLSVVQRLSLSRRVLYRRFLREEFVLIINTYTIINTCYSYTKVLVQLTQLATVLLLVLVELNNRLELGKQERKRETVAERQYLPA